MVSLSVASTANRACLLFPAALPFGMQPLVRPRLDRCELPLQLPPAAQTVKLEDAVVDGGLDRAAGLALVCAVVEAALRRELLDVRERGSEVTFEQLQLAQARRVDHEAAALETEQLAVRRRVSPGAVGRELGGPHQLLAREAVEQGRLAHSG